MLRPVTSTYRLQFGPNLNFEQAAAIVPYVAQLGVSHVYSSPYLQSAPGSASGYDVVDPTKVNEELGGSDGLKLFRNALRASGLGEILDIVPNHMAAMPKSNTWWRDVLEHGSASRYARFFDLDWDPPESKLKQRVLLPILGDHYGKELDQGAFRLARDNASFSLQYYEHDVPIAVSSIGGVLLRAAAQTHDVELESLGAVLPTLQPTESMDIRLRLQEVLDRPGVGTAVDQVLKEITASPQALHELLDLQHYRLAHWRTATDEVDYRRFFDVATLVALRMEDPMVFMETHSLVLKWLNDGELDGIRVDHVDGLRNPEEYLLRLRSAAPDVYIIVEKILGVDERLPATWPVEGTTGYDASSLLDELFVDDGGATQLQSAYASFVGKAETFDEVEEQAKVDALALLRAELRRVCEIAHRVCENDRHLRDYTRREITASIGALLRSLRVYRTYVSDRHTPQDVSELEQASATALERESELDERLVSFFVSVLLGRSGDDPWHAELRARFQQLSGAVMAKGVEDTAFYRYAPLLVLNEVGATPRTRTRSTAQFHEECRYRARAMPFSMVATSTHDSKRGEDVRSRLCALTRQPNDFISRIQFWWDRHRAEEFDDAPMAWFAYQTALGAWPLDLERLQLTVEKSAREAKVRTSWLNIDSVYEDGLRSFLNRIMNDELFRSEMDALVAVIENESDHVTIARTALKVTMPGVPDIYQGSELIHRVLVDPDNRRSVMWQELQSSLDRAEQADSASIGDRKMAMLTHALRLRAAQKHPVEEFAPLEVSGRNRDQVIAFRNGDICAIVCLHSEATEAFVKLPSGTWQDAMQGTTASDEVDVALQPIAVLVKAASVKATS